MRFYRLVYYLYYRSLVLIANRLTFPVMWGELISRFQTLSLRRVHDLKQIYSEGEMSANMGRLLVFLRFVNELKLTNREWEELFQFLVNV